jgi:hypothetical protein
MKFSSLFFGHRPIPVNWHLQIKLNGRLDERTRLLSAITANQDAKKQTNNVKLIPLRRAVNSYAKINDVL